MIGKICLVALLGCVLTQASPLSLGYKRSEPISALKDGNAVAPTGKKDSSVSEFYKSNLYTKLKELRKDFGGLAKYSTATGIGKRDVSENLSLHKGISVVGSAIGEAANGTFHVVVDALQTGLKAGASALPESTRIAKKVIDWTADVTGEALQTADSILLGAKNMVKETIDVFTAENNKVTDENPQEA